MKSVRYVLLVMLLVAAPSVTRAQYSVLGYINCGRNTATCFQQSSNSSGALRCTCSALCLTSSCVTADVIASRSVQWGTYVSPNNPCLLPGTVTAQGGTMPGKSSTISSVYAKTTVTGLWIVNSSQSTMQMDCFDGLLKNDPVLVGIC